MPWLKRRQAVTVHIDREGILGVVRSALAEIVDIEHFPLFWDLDEGEFLGREPGKLGSFVRLSATGGRASGSDDVSYVKGAPGDDTFATVTRSCRIFSLTIYSESDAADPQDMAHELVEHVRHRLEEREKYIDAMLAVRVSVLSSGNVNDLPANWDGRGVSASSVDLECMSEAIEVDASHVTEDGKTSGGGDFFRSVGNIERLP